MKGKVFDYEKVRISFSALQRAEIAEICRRTPIRRLGEGVSVLFNEPKLLKSYTAARRAGRDRGFSALQRAEIAEIASLSTSQKALLQFQCSSTSRNC